MYNVNIENEGQKFDTVLVKDSWHDAITMAIYESIRTIEANTYSHIMITSHDDSSLTMIDLTNYKTTFDRDWKYTLTEPDETGTAKCIIDGITLRECLERADAIMRERACNILCLSADDAEFRASLMILHSR